MPCQLIFLLIFSTGVLKLDFFVTSADMGDFTTTSVEWTANITAGTKVQLSLVDANDNEAWSNVVRFEEFGCVL